MTAVLESVVAVEGHDGPLQTAMARELGLGRSPSLAALRRLSEFPVLGSGVLGYDRAKELRLGRGVRRDRYGQVGYVITTTPGGVPVTLLGHPGYVLLMPRRQYALLHLQRLNHAAYGRPEDWPSASEREAGWRLRVTPLLKRDRRARRTK